AWEAFWAARRDALQDYRTEAAAIQGEPVPPASGSAKLSMIRQKLNKIRALNRKWTCPEEPWAAVSPNLLWNIDNIGAAQITMIGRIVGTSFAPVGACASFGIAVKLAADAIHRGEAKAVVVGMCDPPPHAVLISAFYNANVLSADADVSRPLTARKGTFGHGMSVGGGWELTAQHLGMAKGRLYPIPLTEGELHADVKVHDAKFVQTDGCTVEPGGYAGKLSMGVGGTNSCVISRTWDREYVEAHLRNAAAAPASM